MRNIFHRWQHLDDWVPENSTTEAVESIHLTLVRYTEIVTEIVPRCMFLLHPPHPRLPRRSIYLQAMTSVGDLFRELRQCWDAGG